MLTLKIGSIIIYGTGCICTVKDLCRYRIGGVEKEYYVLQPVFDKKSTISIPADNDDLLGKLRPLLSADEVDSLIRSMPDESADWIQDDRERADSYRKAVASGDRSSMIAVIRSLYQHRCELAEHGRKMRSADEDILQSAEKALYDEFALVLGIDRSEVVSYITSVIEGK